MNSICECRCLNSENLYRKCPCKQYGSSIQSGCTIASGEVYVLVDRTGTHTEAGAAQADIAADNACGKAVSEFGKVVRATLRSVPPPR